MPAKNFYEMLCKDNVFRKDYLQHRDCFRYIEKVRNANKHNSHYFDEKKKLYERNFLTTLLSFDYESEGFRLPG